MNRESIEINEDDTTSFQAVVILYWNGEDEDYLFHEPGRYKVQFDPKGQFDVVVEEPTGEEREMIAQMKGLGLEFAMFVMGPEDNRAVAMAARVEEMLQQHRHTAYARLLSICLGMTRFRNLRPDPEADLNTFLNKRAALMNKYFEPYCSGQIESPYESQAAHYLAMNLLAQARAHSEPGSDDIRKWRRKARMRLEKVKNSPYSIRHTGAAASQLRKLDKVDSTVEGG